MTTATTSLRTIPTLPPRLSKPDKLTGRKASSGNSETVSESPPISFARSGRAWKLTLLLMAISVVAILAGAMPLFVICLATSAIVSAQEFARWRARRAKRSASQYALEQTALRERTFKNREGTALRILEAGNR